MAIIIVAVIILLASTLGYLKYQFKRIREEEKKVFDIIFLRAFFRIIIKGKTWNSFLNIVENITVKRSFDKIKVTELNSYQTSSNGVYIELEERNKLKQNGKKVYVLKYVFECQTKSIVVFTFLPLLYRGFLRGIDKSDFCCIIDSNQEKMRFVDSIEDKIFIVSMQTFLHYLEFIFDNGKLQFEEVSEGVFLFCNEVQETIKILSNTKRIRYRA